MTTHKPVTGKTRNTESDLKRLLDSYRKRLSAGADKSEKLEWRWIMNASSVNAIQAGRALNDLGIKCVSTLPKFPDIKNPTYNISSCTLVGYEVWCSLSEHKMLRAVTEIMQPYYII